MKILIRIIVFFGAAIPAGLGVWELSGRVNISQSSSWWPLVQFFIVFIAGIAAGTVALAELGQFIDSTDARIMNWRASVAITLFIAIAVQIFIGLLIVGVVVIVVNGSSTVPPSNPFLTVSRNADWTPVIKTFDGVAMVLVPPGCFMMGDGDKAHQQCFDTPFWIDRYEVTNAQYGSSGSFSGSNLPRENVTWFEARDFCARRGARLPSEKEWEYAARGPDSLTYPWGNEWKANYAVWNRSQGTAKVGSILAGMSWVGALDMSGNVWEWISSLYWDYPYDASDGREDTANKTDARVLRGGSWFNTSSAYLRAPSRGRYSPAGGFRVGGFRCARPYQDGDLMP